jgi:hypothetical protein
MADAIHATGSAMDAKIHPFKHNQSHSDGSWHKDAGWNKATPAQQKAIKTISNAFV